jgi:rubrerythrin
MTKAQIQEIREKFVGSWLMKKTKMPFGKDGHTGKVAFFLENLNIVAGQLYSSRRDSIIYPIEKVLLELETVTEETAQRYQKLFDSCREISPCVFTERAHTREDGKLKMALSVSNFAVALYSLKLKYPDHDCSAYVCPECGQIHVGKQAKKDLNLQLNMNNKQLITIDGVDYVIDVDKALADKTLVLALKIHSGDVWKRPDGFNRIVASAGQNKQGDSLFTLLSLWRGFNIDYTEMPTPLTVKEMKVFLATRGYTKVGNVNEKFIEFWKNHVDI